MVSIKTKEANELTNAILTIFKQSFDEDFNSKKDQIFETSKNIIYEIKSFNKIEEDTYFISKDLLPGSCYFEFKPGKYKG